MPKWQFLELTDGEVEQEPTQRDQFNNDDVDLAAAVVRESIQNSTDAPNGAGPVKVRFAIEHVGGANAAKFRALFDTLKPHLEICGLSAGPLSDDPVRLLVIEDFNTLGLTGATNQLDEGNFRNFWRRHGRSSKTGKAGGRWGLGKLVYSSASRISSFFGLTIRKGDTGPLLMGQAVLRTHEFEGARRPPHGFWFSQPTPRGLQLPVDDPAIIIAFSELTKIVRSNETGLSIVIPCPRSSITEQSLIAGVVANYYFPILAGHLVVEVGDLTIDRDNFLDVASDIPGLSTPFDFVLAVSDHLNAAPDAEGVLPVNDYEVTPRQFPSELEFLRKKLSDGGLVHVRLPVDVTPRKGSNANKAQRSTFDVFLQSAPPSSEPFVLFARGSLTVPGEKRSYSGTAAWGAMVASSGPIADFLGDAENPAHTLWNATAEKLTENWVNPSAALRNIRFALRQLQQLLGEQIEQIDPDALIDFFSLLDQSATGEARKRRRTRRKPVEVTPREKAFQVEAHIGGFAIISGPAAKKWSYPATIRVRVAYDIIGGDPFKRWSPFDFKMDDQGLKLSLTNATITSAKGNVLRVAAASPDFRIEADGFDINRDILVEARSI
jgi:hypothetical protein